MVERIANINWHRIQWCCAERHITTEELAAAIDVSHSLFAALERGEAALTYNQLRRMASYFGRGVLFFLEHGPVNPEKVFTNGFRTLANQKVDMESALKRIIERAEWQREAYLSLRADIGDDAVEDFDPPTLTGMGPQRAVAGVRDWLGLDGVSTFEGYRQAIERKGILVFRTNGYQGKWQVPKSSSVLGLAIYHEAFPLIVVRKARFESRQTFTLIHELAHILLHKDSVIDEDADLSERQSEGREREANQFAAQLLVPDALAANINVREMPTEASEFDAWLAPWRKVTGASSEVHLLRLLALGRISRDAYDDYKAWQSGQSLDESDGGTRMYRYREPKHIFGDGYVRTVLTALNQKRISLTRASRFLDGLKLNDLHKLESYCAGH
ncbi:ImmA/IrrE family metallo-endopeptidase [Stenotrophomonas sp. ISL-67]|nr:ImmA/IrrE family metallo-endopeptidase [Stenotrophomonas sp. ISL-67]